MVDGEKKKRLISQAVVGGVLAVVTVMIFLFPFLLRRDSSLSPVEFITLEQSEENGVLFLRGSFWETMPEGETLWLYAENAKVEITLSGVTHCFNERGNTPALFRSPGSGWYSLSVPALSEGELVDIAIESYYGENAHAAENMIGRFYSGDGVGFFALLLDQINFFGILQLCAAIAGLIYMLEGAVDMVLGMTEGTRIFLFGLYLFTGALWCIPDVLYPYLGFLLNPPWAAALVDVMGLLLFPVALALMMQYYIRGKKAHLVMQMILWLEILLAAGCVLRQLLGRADLIEQQLIIGGVALLCLATAMVCVVLELLRYRDRHLLFLFLSVLPVFFSEILDGINIIWPFMPRRFLMQYSFSLSIVMLTVQFVSYANTALAKAEAMRKREQALVESRISIMLSQIKPHFLFNALTGIKTLCSRDPERAEDAMEHFSFFLRGNLDCLSDSRLIPFDKEISHLKDYFYLEKMRFGERVNLVLDLEFRDFLLPPMTLQPLVENAVRYGLVKKEDGGTVTIRSCLSEGKILLTIQDDGAGFDENLPLEDGHSHIGIENVRGRLALQCGGTLEVESEKSIGTKVRITLPRKEELPCE